MINYEKLEIYFSGGVPKQHQIELIPLLGVKEIWSLPKYLGLPTLVERSKKAILKEVKDRVLRKIQG